MSGLVTDVRVLGYVQTNCYIVHKEGSSEAIVVDPADKGGYIKELLDKKGLTLAGILLTHGHFDHISGCEELRKLTGARVYAHETEKALCTDSSLNCSDMTMRPVTVTPDVLLRDGEDLSLAGISIKCIHTPGHTAGSACYYVEEEDVLFAGDTLFYESVGRTDLETGSPSDMLISIRKKLFVLPGNTRVLCGHGEETDIEHEKTYNPFC